MTEFVTTTDVDTLLGAGWEGVGDKDRAVLEANTYLSTLRFKAWETQPENVTLAGAELAKLSIAGTLYTTQQSGAVKRKRTKVEGIESETEYAVGSREVSSDMAFIHDLLAPHLLGLGATRILRRL